MKQSRSGFTLVELMVALSLALTLSAAVYLIFSHLQGTYARALHSARLEEEAGALMELVAKRVRNAVAIEVGDGWEPPVGSYAWAFSHRTVDGRDVVVYWYDGKEAVLTGGGVELHFEGVPAEGETGRYYRNALLVRVSFSADSGPGRDLRQVVHLPNLPCGTGYGPLKGQTLWFNENSIDAEDIQDNKGGDIA